VLVVTVVFVIGDPDEVCKAVNSIGLAGNVRFDVGVTCLTRAESFCFDTGVAAGDDVVYQGNIFIAVIVGRFWDQVNVRRVVGDGETVVESLDGVVTLMGSSGGFFATPVFVDYSGTDFIVGRASFSS
jgi:hypothetical protein